MATVEERVDNRLVRRRAVVVAMVFLGVAAALWLVTRLSNLLFMVFVAGFIAIALEPPVHFLAKRGWKRGLATGAVFVAGFLLFVGFAWALFPLFIEQFHQLVDAIPEYFDSVVGFLQNTLGFDLTNLQVENIGEDLLKAVQNIGSTLAVGLIGLTASVAGFLIFVTTVALFAFYMVAELPQLQRTLLSFMPEVKQRRALHIWDVAVENMGGYIYSRLLLAAISATISTIVMSLFGVPFAVSLGIWVGVLSQFLPVIGTYLAAILPAIVALTFNTTGTMVAVVVYFIAYQQVENYLVAPWLTRRTMEIHPAVSVAAIFAGGALLGGVGVVLALPVTGIIQAIISETRRRHDVVIDETEDLPGD